MTDNTSTYIRDIRKPGTFAVLPAACDSHCHIFGPGHSFPYAPSVTPPPDAGKEAMFKMNATIGVERRIIVQTVNHGYDHSVVIDAWRAKPETTRAIALVPLGVSDEKLRHLNDHGFRGVRFHLTANLAGGETPDAILAFAQRLAKIGWHIQLHIDEAGLEAAETMIAASPVAVVLDHLGYPDASRGLDQPGFQRVLKLMGKNRHVWAKTSGVERASRQGYPYEDAWPFARTLVQNFGDRVLWGTDWPHPKVSGGAPDDGLLMELVAQYAPTKAERQALLVDNPDRLFWIGV
ncbi:amidohydrolase family protein [Rhizobium lusitanum]|uniref:Amidohydrolase family protein n=1 Tax=Rhizobium lusitanum TaxID=293958 RepID=A0A6L9UEX2_9HYPH|nr:amidohydrolase family protein [Rhizobium lusitanum]NEI73148.1 amidohydrolase family protein [Rhizobium lusitanum]